MSINPDYLAERKLNKNTIRNLKLIAIVLLLVIAFLSSQKLLKSNKSFLPTPSKGSDYIALLRIEDVIFEDYKKEKKILELKEDKNVKAVVVYINSPGGSAGASERMYSILKSIKQNKPVVAVMGTVAASGGYMISLAAEHIIAYNSTLTGSIGVLTQNVEITELAEKMGISLSNFKSSELKAAPNYSEKVTQEVREATMSTVLDIYNFFVGLIAENRKIPIEDVIKISDGRVYTGRQAFALGLIDEIGTTENALDWLQKNKGLSKDLELKEVNLIGLEESLRDIIFGDAVKALNYGFTKMMSILKFGDSQTKVMLK